MTTFNVTNNTQLQSALTSARGGDTIVLAAGNYGKSYISNRDYSSTVTIKSATPLKAHFDYLQVSGSSNLRLEGLDVGHKLSATESQSTHYARVTNSDHIKMVGMAFHGSLDNNPANDGIGLNVTGTTHFQLTGSSFRDLYRGAFIQQASDVTVASNSFQMIRTDGLNFGAVNGAVIDKNTFTNFHPAVGDHADAIQFWLVNQPYGSSNISITNNVIMQGTGTGVQGIFMSDPMSYGYKNVLIQNNLVYGNDQYHGIYLNGVNGAQVIGNTLLSASNDSKRMWINLYKGSNFVVKDNLADSIEVKSGATGVTMSHNANLMYDGGMRSQIPDLNSPTSAKDLIISNYGYQLSGTAPGTGTSSSNIDSTAGAAPSTHPVTNTGGTTGTTTSTHPVANTGSTTGTTTSTHLVASTGSTIETATSAQVSKAPVPHETASLPSISQLFPTSTSNHVELPTSHAGLPTAQAGLPTLHVEIYAGTSSPIYQPHLEHFVAMA